MYLEYDLSMKVADVCLDIVLSNISNPSGRSSEIRHRNQLTAKASKKAVQELGKMKRSCEQPLSRTPKRRI